MCVVLVDSAVLAISWLFLGQFQEIVNSSMRGIKVEEKNYNNTIVLVNHYTIEVDFKCIS